MLSKTQGSVHHHLQALKCFRNVLSQHSSDQFFSHMQTEPQAFRVKSTTISSEITQDHSIPLTTCLILWMAECWFLSHWCQQLKDWHEETLFQIKVIFLLYPGFLCNCSTVAWTDTGNNAVLKKLQRVLWGTRNISVLTTGCNTCTLKQSTAAQWGGPVYAISPLKSLAVLAEMWMKFQVKSTHITMPDSKGKTAVLQHWAWEEQLTLIVWPLCNYKVWFQYQRYPQPEPPG